MEHNNTLLYDVFHRKENATLAENTIDKSRLKKSFSASTLNSWACITANSTLTMATAVPIILAPPMFR